MNRKTLTKAQQRTLQRLVARDEGRTWPNYLAARRAGYIAGVAVCFMIEWAGMCLGIEADGHMHS
ncbi:hypothetical protein SAMN06265338_12618 [Rhodoblastus acidophilus]|uniref:Uncharacterized protein n=1 Tax=Rhodoblastus acidophilus TaxID=1074 RepID=A0A212SCV6_RHOAC|nr:hypothetical protein [Rhodoblastus acidophilus]PPQ35579.1 hypothetical protein CKO16_20260 [Rhodoblastus acidophilus]RAI16996.1 hypothetical protein CH337_18470 [Rhodoblastus acidophilus]SNB83380.1 hypothetical protein SAMN06265338_12618 [Rhodoblastus acidophilus]